MPDSHPPPEPVQFNTDLPMLPDDDNELSSPPLNLPDPIVEDDPPEVSPRSRQKIKSPIDYSQVEDLDLPIAVRRSKRPKTSPLKFWKGEKVVYSFHESGCWTQKDVVKVHSKKNSFVKQKKITKEDHEKSIDVLPKRDEPGEEGDEFIKFFGLNNRAVKSDEFFIMPGQSMVFTAAKNRIVLTVYEGKARISSNQRKWQVSVGGKIYIGRGNTCKLKNESKDQTVRLVSPG
jgi:quercetin dioxygenase-like cupin family protein